MQLRNNSALQNGKYRIIRVLGQGGFGITYLVENVLLDKKVAIKEFFPKEYCDRDSTSRLTLGTQNNAETVSKLKDRFLKEARNIAKLDHPGIIKIHDIFEENNTAYYVMDYIEGESLNEIVRREGPMTEERALNYIRQVGEALEYIHSRNMTHFDVKPANIMLRRSDNKPVLIDFGLSKQYDNKGDATSAMMNLASPGYSPIELYNTGSITTFSPQTDVYSLGATLYFLLTGMVPPSALEIVETGLKVPTSILLGIRQVIENSVQFSRAKRTESIAVFLNNLSNIDKSKRDRKLSRINESSHVEETKLINAIPVKDKIDFITRLTINRTLKEFIWWVVIILILLIISYVVVNGGFGNSAGMSVAVDSAEVAEDVVVEEVPAVMDSIGATVEEVAVMSKLTKKDVDEILNNTTPLELRITEDEIIEEEIRNPDFDKGTEDLHVVRGVENTNSNEHETFDENKIYNQADQRPQFPGGEAALLKYISDNLKYPSKAAENMIQGRVVVQFVVTKTGSIGDVKILRGKDPDLDKEAIRVVKTLPKFAPGKIHGIPVDVWYTVPVSFRLYSI